MLFESDTYAQQFSVIHRKNIIMYIIILNISKYIGRILTKTCIEKGVVAEIQVK